MLFLQVAIAVYIVSMFVFLIHNYRGYREVPQPSQLPTSPPLVSVIVPTQDEALALRNCLSSLGRQDYPNLEILVVNEGPMEETARVVEEISREYSPVELLQIDAGSIESTQHWAGKNFAQHQGALKARGEWLLFLNPTVVLQPPCISRCMAFSMQNRIDFCSVMPGQELRTFWEKLILPIVFGWFGTRFSIARVNDPNSTQAIGVSEFMLIRRKAYQVTGGFQNVRGEILEDSALAREVKNAGLAFRLVGGRNLVTSRTYGDLSQLWQRCERVFVGEVGSSPVSILWNFLIIALTGVAPFASVLWCAYRGVDLVNPYLLAVTIFQCVIVLTARLVLDYVLRIGPYFAFLHPVGSIFSLAILISSLYHLSAGSLEHVRGRVSSEL